jgi:3-oxoacyl-[acyl-carrier-protein] synthase I
MPSPIAIISVGMVSSLGLSADATCAAVRAHVARFEELPFLDSEGEPVVGAAAPEAARGRQGVERLGLMLCGALSDCVTGGTIAQSEVLQTVPCLVVAGLGEPQEQAEALGRNLLRRISASFGQPLHADSCAISAADGVFGAMQRVRDVLTRNASCILIAADSLINRGRLASLELAGKLKTSGNSDGVIPGEAAAALWLSMPGPGPAPVLAWILGTGVNRNEEPTQVGRPVTGLALSQAMSQALGESGESLYRMDFRVGGMTGERLGFVEASTALARIQKVHKDDFELWVPAEQLGDVGAALPACMLVTAAKAFADGDAPGSRAILFHSSDHGTRGAFVLAAAGGD